MKSRSRGLGALAVLVALATPAAIGAQHAGQVFDPAALPERVRLGSFSGKLRKGYQEGRVTFVADKKSVDFHWTSSALTNQAPDWGTYGATAVLSTNSREYSKYKTLRSSVSANFFVTACGRRSDSELLFAGTNASGRTVIQRWTFVWPSSMPEPETDQDTWLDSVDIVVPGVQKSVVQLGPLGQTPVRVITGIAGLRAANGECSKAIVQYAAPNDVYQIDLATAAMTLLASETDGSGALGALPSLGIKHYSGIGTLDHSEDGYLYFFNLGSSAVSAFYGGAPVDDDDVRLHLVDSDRDGVIDVALEMSTLQAKATGHLDLDSYTDWWLE